MIPSSVYFITFSQKELKSAICHKKQQVYMWYRMQFAYRIRFMNNIQFDRLNEIANAKIYAVYECRVFRRFIFYYFRRIFALQ